MSNYYNNPNFKKKKKIFSKDANKIKNDQENNKDDKYLLKDLIIDHSRNSNNNNSMKNLANKNMLNTPKKLIIKQEILLNVEDLNLSSPKFNKYYDKLVKLKNYDNVVKSLSNVKNLVTFNKGKPLSPNSLINDQNTSIMLESSPSKILPKILHNASSMINLAINNNLLESLTPNIKKSDNSIHNQSNLIEIEEQKNKEDHILNFEKANRRKKNKSIDNYKLRLLKIYKTSLEKEEILNNVKLKLT